MQVIRNQETETLKNESIIALNNYKNFKKIFGSSQQLDECTRLVVAFHEGEFDDFDVIERKMANIYRMESSIKKIARQTKESDPKHFYNQERAKMLDSIITNLEQMA
jgi:hypothetical protein